jgi:polar amino acid transport system substrate-binding protein
MAMSKTAKQLTAALAGAFFALAALAQTPAVPPPGTSPRIDKIKQSGALRVGVISGFPWLVENTSGKGEPWQGPVWLLAHEYARLLGVKLEAVPVSHETKVPALAANQIDLTIAPLAQTPARMEVIDFVIYSSTSLCMFGLANNPKFANAKSVDDLNSPDITIAYFTGGGEEKWVPQRFPKAKLRAVSSAGASAPVEEIMAKRADAAPINRVPWVSLNKKVKGLAVLPAAEACQQSTEGKNLVGLGIDKNQPALLEWLRAVEKQMEPKLQAEERRMIEAGS